MYGKLYCRYSLVRNTKVGQQIKLDMKRKNKKNSDNAGWSEQ